MSATVRGVMTTRVVAVTVRGGIVTLSGPVRGAYQARTVVESVQHLQGVVAVRDRLSYPARPPATDDGKAHAKR